jgi:polyisoprenoid-binding protein YceI
MKGLYLAPLALFVALSGASAQEHGSAASHAQKAAKAPAHLKFVVSAIGNEARYRVREEIAGLGFPSDAIGVTKDIAGTLVVDPTGKVIRDSSKIVVLVSSLKSDKSQRDRYIKKHALESDKFPQVTLVPVSFEGLTEPIAPGTTKSFTMLGDLTVRNVTRPTVWQVTARTQGPDIVGTAKTQFTFKDFDMEQPHSLLVMSVEDTVKLEYDFHFSPVTTP